MAEKPKKCPYGTCNKYIDCYCPLPQSEPKKETQDKRIIFIILTATLILVALTTTYILYTALCK